MGLGVWFELDTMGWYEDWGIGWLSVFRVEVSRGWRKV